MVVTKPFSVSIREKLLKTYGNDCKIDCNAFDLTGDCDGNMHAVWLLQRAYRSELVDEHFFHNSVQNSNGLTSVSIHAPVSHGQGNYLSELLPFRNYYRTKKQSRREMKAVEKEEKRRRFEIDERRRKKNAEYLKAVMLHRDDFFRFHKNKRSGKHFLTHSTFFVTLS